MGNPPMATTSRLECSAIRVNLGPAKIAAEFAPLEPFLDHFAVEGEGALPGAEGDAAAELLLEFLDLVASHQHRAFRAGQKVTFSQVVAGPGTGDDEVAGADPVAQVTEEQQLLGPAESADRRRTVLTRPAQGQELVDQDILGHGLAVVGNDQAGVFDLGLDGDPDVAGAGRIGTVLQELAGQGVLPIGVVV